MPSHETTSHFDPKRKDEPRRLGAPMRELPPDGACQVTLAVDGRAYRYHQGRNDVMRTTSTVFAAIMMMACIANASAAETVAVIDGDTIDIGGTRYRLHGIDAPEAGQTCAKQGGGTWQCGKQAI